MMAGGAFVGGFVAGRASRGETLLEPAIGAIAVIGTIVGLAAGTEIGKYLWHVNSEGTIKFVGLVGGLAAGGALAGAFLSEKLGEATASSGPWVIYTAFATFGSCVLATVIASVVLAGRAAAAEGGVASGDAIGQALLAGIAAGCLLAGIAVGASARTRPLLAALLGAILGTAGFALLVTNAATGGEHSSDTIAGIAVFGVGGGVVTLIGALIGWALFGKKRAG
jgi:hypothetical protein